MKEAVLSSENKLLNQASGSISGLDNPLISNESGFNGLESLASPFLDEQDISRASKKTYRTALSGFFDFLNSQNIKRPARTDLIRYKEVLSFSHTAHTVNLRMSVIRNFFKWTHFYGLYPDIAFGIKGVRGSREPKRRALTSSQVRSILDNIDRCGLCGRQKYALVLLASTTGLRAAEICALDIGDLSTARDQTVLSVKGKGMVDKDQTVPIGEMAEEAVRAALALRENFSLDDPLFISTSNRNYGERITPKGMSRLLKNILKDNNFTGRFYTGHSFRHTACCLGLEAADHDLVGVKRFMRHSNIETTMIYADHEEAVSSNIARGIEEKLKPES